MLEMAAWMERQQVPIVVNEHVPPGMVLIGDLRAAPEQGWTPLPAPPFPGRVEVITMREEEA